jgi:hypothetical protein
MDLHLARGLRALARPSGEFGRVGPCQRAWRRSPTGKAAGQGDGGRGSPGKAVDGDRAPVDSGDWLRVPQLCGVEEGVRERSIDQKEAWRRRSPWLDGRRRRSGRIRRESSNSGGRS